MLRNVSFMGASLELDDELIYHASFDYWVKINWDKRQVTFGLTPASNIKEGGYRSLEYFLQEGETVTPGDPLALAITAKIKYLDVVAGGVVVALNRELEQDTASCQNAMGDSCWLASINADDEARMLTGLIDFNQYIGMLRHYEKHAISPGSKYSVSPTCRSVYESIRKQKE